ncbi:inorganic diphosphatase [Halteromyces radiatus]|uniref:inorganic diphosphatase n=1 Tax=Halteromyces radiatus TaxID=101107 RepID=UPI002220D281|nr:inorganic diphosphatase [Halteromyces radiatus]KAI8078813.1 inorganic diphosphatase [Halteromyces radiatus]
MPMVHSFRTRKIGAPFTKEHEIYFETDNGELISPFHDIPLFAQSNVGGEVFNMVVEIPRWTNAKFEINKETPLNPIKQDIAKSTKELRFVPNIYPFKGYLWNYGALPQTWEDPHHMTKDTNAKGDNDPIDVIEIGDQVGETGQVKQVKLLGVFGLIDQGETDWKLVTIDINDPLANMINDIGDVEKHKPGLLKDTARFFRIYKIPQGKKANTLAFHNMPRNKAYATQLVYETHDYWKALVNGTAVNKKIQNLSIEGSPFKLAPNADMVVAVSMENNLPAAPLPSTVDEWHYIDKWHDGK